MVDQLLEGDINIGKIGRDDGQARSLTSESAHHISSQKLFCRKVKWNRSTQLRVLLDYVQPKVPLQQH
jgi:hypothetical protein